MTATAGTPPNTSPTPLGSINSTPQLALSQGYQPGNSTGKYATYLKLFSGELFKAYQASCIAKGTVQNRTLKNGKSMQFIFSGRMQADYHVPGTPILGSGDPPVAEKTILMDDLLISSAFVYDLDETLAHYSLRSEISKKIGYALAEAYDKRSSVPSLLQRGKLIQSPQLQAQNLVVPSSNLVPVMSTTHKH